MPPPNRSGHGDPEKFCDSAVATIMGGDTTPSRAVAQSAGLAFRLKAQLLKDEFERFAPTMHTGPHSAWWPPIGWPVTPNGRWGVSDNQREEMRQAVTLCGNRGFTSIRRKEPRH